MRIEMRTIINKVCFKLCCMFDRIAIKRREKWIASIEADIQQLYVLRDDVRREKVRLHNGLIGRRS